MRLFDTNWNRPDPEKPSEPPNEEQVLDKLAQKVVEKGMSVPAILFLESVKPLNFIGSQTMVFFEPIVQSVFNFRDYNTLREALEKRETIENVLLRIEHYDCIALAREKRIKRYLKQQKKDWTWSQRWLGIGRPKLRIPEEVLNPPAEEEESSPSAPTK